MSTYTQILYQIVFSTKNREQTLVKLHREELYKYIWSILKNKQCHLYQINGVEDHLHILIHLHPSVSLASLIKDIKLSTGEFIKEQKLFPLFDGWQEGYGAFTYSFSQKNILIAYIKNQEEHHKNMSFWEEYVQLLREHSIAFEEKYLF